VPDVALNANPDTGFIIYCTAGFAKCGGSGWFPIGGTSGSAPLLAGIVADANESSRLRGGARLGFANPFLYANQKTSIFNDIVDGNNSITRGTTYSAGPGFDMATGLGSVNATPLANALAAFTASPPTQTAAFLTVAGPPSGKAVGYGNAVTFHGTLLNNGSQPIRHEPVYVETRLGDFRDVTNAAGEWSITLAKKLKRNLTWKAVFVGSDTRRPAATAGRRLYVRPHLTSVVDLPRSGTRYIARVGRFFTFHGRSTPNMHGAQVLAQYRYTGRPWHALATARVGPAGKYSARVRDSRPETFLLRWVFRGGIHHKWLSAVAKAKRVTAR
jgi:hypothetical protein